MKPIITPLPEVADRYTIAKLKIERLDETEIDVAEMQRQIDYYKEGLEQDNPKLDDLINKLYHINGLMWDAEYAIRKGQDEGLGLEEIFLASSLNLSSRRSSCSLISSIVTAWSESN